MQPSEGVVRPEVSRTVCRRRPSGSDGDREGRLGNERRLHDRNKGVVTSMSPDRYECHLTPLRAPAQRGGGGPFRIKQHLATRRQRGGCGERESGADWCPGAERQAARRGQSSGRPQPTYPRAADYRGPDVEMPRLATPAERGLSHTWKGDACEILVERLPLRW
jgi:hypothetical protein